MYLFSIASVLMVKVPWVAFSGWGHLHLCKSDLELIIFRQTLLWIFYDPISLYLSWFFVTIKPLENSYQLFKFAQQAHQNLSEWPNDKAPNNMGIEVFDISVFIITFFKTMWEHKHEQEQDIRCLMMMLNHKWSRN